MVCYTSQSSVLAVVNFRFVHYLSDDCGWWYRTLETEERALREVVGLTRSTTKSALDLWPEPSFPKSHLANT